MKKCEIERPWLLPILSNKILLLLQLAPIGKKMALIASNL